jgi:8-oxo-dGTP diphosphatase
VTVAGKPGRDPRKHIISIVYYVKVETSEVKAGDDASHAAWYDLKEVIQNTDGSKTLAFDHKEILQEFVKKFYPSYV